MGRLPRRPCRNRFCAGLAEPGKAYCDECEAQGMGAAQQKTDRAEYDRQRGTTATRGYGARWQRIQKSVLDARPFCARCARRAILVHHRDRNTRNNDPANLEPLCLDCHAQEHADQRRHPEDT